MRGDLSRVADGFRCRRCDGTIQEVDLAEDLINNKALPMATHPKVLGLTLDPKLTYSTHIHNISVQAHKTLLYMEKMSTTFHLYRRKNTAIHGENYHNLPPIQKKKHYYTWRKLAQPSTYTEEINTTIHEENEHSLPHIQKKKNTTIHGENEHNLPPIQKKKPTTIHGENEHNLPPIQKKKPLLYMEKMSTTFHLYRRKKHYFTWRK